MTILNDNSWVTPDIINSLVAQYGNEVAGEYLRSKFKLPENKMAFALICFPHHFTEKSPSFHQEMFNIMSLPINTGIAAPRGFAKSTVVMVDDIFDIVNGCRDYIVKISDSYTQALEHTNTLQNELETNDVLRWLYGEMKTDNWASGEFVTSTGVKVVAKGQGMKVRGLKYNQYRPDKVNIDDLENDELVENPERRKKLKRWFKMGVIPAMAKGGKINIVGTILHHDALLAKIVSGTDEFSGWEVRIFKALNEIEGHVLSLWPEMYSAEYLIGMRDDPKHPKYIGSITFSQEYQNEPMSDEDAVIKRNWIQYQDHPPAIKVKIIVIDPAISKKEKADNTSIQCWGLGYDDKAYCLEKVVGKFSFMEQGTHIRAMYQRWDTDDCGVSKVLIEAVAYQQALKEHEKLKSLPVVEIKPNKDKRTRLIVVSKWFEAGVVYLRSSMDSLADELVNFGSMAHDDEADCATMAITELKNETEVTTMSFV